MMLPPATGYEGHAPWGEPLRLPQAGPVHVIVGAPWRTALADLRGENRRLRARWEVPAGAAEGDTALVVVEARCRAVVGLTTVRRLARGLVPARTTQLLPLGAATAGVARRLGEDPLGSAATLADQQARAVVDAVSEEQVRPTPWALTGENACTRPARRWFQRHHAGVQCTVCGAERDEMAHPAASAGFDEHVVREDDGSLAEPGSLVPVCATCHAVLHSPLGPTVDELVFAQREPCPNPTCGARRTWVTQFGMPAGPPPLGVHLGGCVMEEPLLDSSCDVCGLAWREDEDGVGYASLPGSLTRWDPEAEAYRQLLSRFMRA